nr:HAMP domain-containing protein [Anaerolineae bacterium]
MAAERIERPRGSLVNKVRWPIVTSIAIALLVVGYVLINISARAQREGVFHIQQKTAEEIALHISVYLQDAMSDLALFAQTGDLVAGERTGQQAALDRLLAHRQPVYEEITLLDRAGNEVARVCRFHTFLPAELGSQADTAAFRRARKGLAYMDKEVVISPYSGLPVVGMAVPVYDPVTGDVTGVLAARVSVKRMWDVVAAVEIGEHGYAYVVNTTGHLLAHADLSRYLQLQGKPIDYVAVVEKIVQVGIAEPGVEEYTGLEGERIVGAYAPVEGTSWVAIVELPTAEAYASIQRMRVSLVGLLVVAVLAITGLASWLPQRIVRPLAQLEEGAALLSSGRLDHRIVLRTGDELEALGKAFNQMASRLQELYAGLEQ